jgi:transposase InsO family protein
MFIIDVFKSRRRLEVENLFLRHQLNIILRRPPQRLRLRESDRASHSSDGIRDRPISPRSPWQNPYAERLIGTLRRECLDHVLIVGERHLRRMLASYSSYYNESRTHLALEKDAPLRRAIQRCGAIITTPILSGLHHRYVRI